ncbi:helix-turn-helix domain-containing protein [Glaciibacter psychrotolerans]|uniref:Transcriptional regulator with XRE-family HTH domain n=1 Tax=Glaciibacter psychrotolerans TaxID=670054 RepID=A0A7Z0EFZ4_9MICO|nr:cupin domain-containing protein [Leifsonia psychrotolerans]NYJ20515.1 transcriptional regulator with XRE-family HTH domain [Leifsonia psychrotolerans]
MTEVEVHLGRRIAEFRELRGLTLRGLAANAGVSSSFLSQLENSRASASISSMRKISEALGVSVADLLGSHNGHARGVVRAQDRPEYPSGAGSTKFVIAQPPMRNLEIYKGVFEPGGSTGDDLYSHGKSQEIFIVLHGTVELSLGTEVIRMNADDSIEYLSSVPHRVINVGDGQAEVMWVTSPPTA